jgi:hypothetical protein
MPAHFLPLAVLVTQFSTPFKTWTGHVSIVLNATAQFTGNKQLTICEAIENFVNFENVKCKLV